MAKQKTNKAAAKRIRITKNGKAVKITAGQGHFNSRESGKTKMNKRRNASLSKAATKIIKKQLPHK
jgi:ribosomal protein L35